MAITSYRYESGTGEPLSPDMSKAHGLLKYAEGILVALTPRIVKLCQYAPVNAFWMNCEINAATLCGRTMLTIIFPDKDFISFVGTEDATFGLHAIYLETTSPNDVVSFCKKFVISFSEEMFLQDRSLRIL